MSFSVQSIDGVVSRNLCTGCGLCAGKFPDAIRMVDDTINGRRPVVDKPSDPANVEALSVCAGIGAPLPPAKDDIEQDWGPLLAAWEGWAADEDIRHRGSSGGAVTALALFALQQGQVSGVAHIAARNSDARLNKTVISRDREGLLRAAGSRYAQASPGEILPEVMAHDGPVAFVGKPCDVASLAKAGKADEKLAAQIGMTFAIFCAGAPNLHATNILLDRLEVPKNAKLTELRYRGEGWPGLMKARYIDAGGQSHESKGIPYAEGWGRILQVERRWRCRICDDHTGIYADISIGDPWHNPPEGDLDDGRSLIVAKTDRGRALVEAAIAAGAIVAEPCNRDIIYAAQPNLMDTNAAVWGRRLAMRLMLLDVPKGGGAARFSIWWRHLGTKAKLQSVAGTLKRIIRMKLWQPVTISEEGKER